MATIKTNTVKVSQPDLPDLQKPNSHSRFPTMMLTTDNASKIKASTQLHSFKLLMLGHGKTGKTSIVRRFVQNKFLSTYKMTFGAAQWNFKCQVPVNLMEEIPKDENLLHSMTSFFNMDQTDLAELQDDLDEMQKHEQQQAQAQGGVLQDHDPFEDDDKNAEFGGNLFPSSFYPIPRQPSAVANYGQFTAPQINIENDIRKTSVNLNIDLDIIDVGFHPTEDELYDGVNAIILVVDYSNEDSITESFNKYESFVKNIYLKGKNLEYIPLIVAANKCDVDSRQFRKKDIKKKIKKILMPIIESHFGTNDESNAKNKMQDKHAHITGNTTLLQTPNLSFVYDKNAQDSDMEQSDNEQKSDPDDDGLKQAHKEKKKKKKLKKTDLRYINVISCSAKSGRNIERLFESCIKKTLPAKLSQSVTHSRQQTTAQITAPIWLRNLVTDFERSTSSLNHPYFDTDDFVDDNFEFVDDK